MLLYNVVVAAAVRCRLGRGPPQMNESIYVCCVVVVTECAKNNQTAPEVRVPHNEQQRDTNVANNDNVTGHRTSVSRSG